MHSKAAITIRGEAPRFARGPWFLLALFLALASALVPALSPTGVATPVRMLGSAFDPTNDVKTLRGRERGAILVAVSSGQTKDASVAGPVILPAMVQETTGAAQAYPALPLIVAKAQSGAPSRTRSPAQPRAPPAQAI